MDKASYRPVVVAMKGHPGCGKSTIARSVATALSCPLLDKDDIRDATLSLQQSFSTASSALNDLSYGVLWRMVETQLSIPLPFIIVDSPLSRRSHLDQLLLAAANAKTSARVVIVECLPGDEEEWKRRLEERGKKNKENATERGWHKPGTWEELRRLVESYGRCFEYEITGVPQIVVDTTAKGVSTAEMVAAVLEFIRSHAKSLQ